MSWSELGHVCMVIQSCRQGTWCLGQFPSLFSFSLFILPLFFIMLDNAEARIDHYFCSYIHTSEIHLFLCSKGTNNNTVKRMLLT